MKIILRETKKTKYFAVRLHIESLLASLNTTKKKKFIIVNRSLIALALISVR